MYEVGKEAALIGAIEEPCLHDGQGDDRQTVAQEYIEIEAAIDDGAVNKVGGQS